MVPKFPSNITVAMVPLRRVMEIHEGPDGRVHLLGSDGKFLNILAQALNFEYSINIPPDNEWGRKTDDGNWTGMIGQVFRGEADFTLWSTATKERLEVVDFSEPYAVNELTYVTTLPGYTPKEYVFFYPFDLVTWCCITLIIFVAPLLFRWFSSSGPSYFERLLYLYGSILHQPLIDDHFYNRFLLGSWWVASLVLSLSYSGALSSFLSMPLRENPIRNFHDLAVASSKGQYRAVDLKGTVTIPSLLATEREDLVLLANTIIKNDWFLTFAESQSENHFDGRTAQLGSRTFLNFRFGKAPFTRMYISEDTAFSFGMAMGMSKKFCCKKQLDSVIVKIKYAGIYQKLLEDEMYRSWLQFVGTLKTPDSKHQISIHDLSGALIIFAVGNGASILVFIVEYYLQKAKAIMNIHEILEE